MNATWPNPSSLRLHRAAFPYSRVVLQLGPGALNAMGYHSRAIAERVRDDYGDSVTDVLVDVSGGRGVMVRDDRIEQVKNLLRDLRDHGDWTIGMAGGLDAAALSDAETMGAWRQLLRAGCSIDAEGRLRDDAAGGGNIDLAKMCAYLRAAVALASDAISPATTV